MNDKLPNDFATAAQEEAGRGCLSDFWEFLRYNKKWWLLPILVMLILLGALLALSGSAAAPFIYTLF
jgi:drug/metabolite transporter superfamily protein YnfA